MPFSIRSGPVVPAAAGSDSDSDSDSAPHTSRARGGGRPWTPAAMPLVPWITMLRTPEEMAMAMLWLAVQDLPVHAWYASNVVELPGCIIRPLSEHAGAGAGGCSCEDERGGTTALR